MRRRDFIRNSALAGLATAMPLAAEAAGKKKTKPTEVPKEPELNAENQRFKFRPDGKFKILQFTDTHYITGDNRSPRALKNVIEMLDAEKPDLVIHTGDIIFGKPAEQSLKEILAPMGERKIPFSVAMGNHDGQYDKNRKEVFDIVKTLPGNINRGIEGIYGDSNDLITLVGADGQTKWAFYLFDSGDSCSDPDIKGYDYIHWDQINWYRQTSAKLRQQNGDKPLPSLAFFHIPVPEFTWGLRYDTHRILKGNFGEDPCPPSVNSGLFVSMKEMGDVQAIICGHDHDDDYAMQWRGLFLIYGRFSGCDTVYNNLKPNGARVIELTEGQPGFRSWIRCFGGEVCQDLRFPDAFKKY